MEAIQIFLLLCVSYLNTLPTNVIKSSKILPNGGISDDKFKYSVAASGNFVIVGCPYEDLYELEDVGFTSIFYYNGEQWDDGLKIIPDNMEEFSNFGYSVAISDTQVIVGSPFDTEKTNKNSTGSAYIYNYINGSWIEKVKLGANDGACNDQFGYAVAINKNYAVVGNPSSFNDTGSVHVFIYYGEKWMQQAKIVATDGGRGDWFGGAVSMYDNFIVVGASWRYSDSGFGSAYIYKRCGKYWLQEAKIQPQNPDIFGYFGSRLDISNNRVVIGSIAENSYSGVAHLFKRNTDGIWFLEKIFTDTDGKGGGMFSGDRFGGSVAISGETIAISAPCTDDKRINSGTVYMFKYINDGWIQVRKLSPWDGNQSDGFGFSVALDNNVVVVSSVEGEGTGNLSGSAYIFNI